MANDELVPQNLTLKELLDLQDVANEDLQELQAYAKELVAGKIDRIAIMVKEVIPAHIEACKDQIKRLDGIRERLTHYTHQLMQEREIKELNGLSYRARVQNSPPSVVVYQSASVPGKFCKSVVTISGHTEFSEQELVEAFQRVAQVMFADYGLHIGRDIDKKALKEVFESGGVVPGCELEQGTHVRFEAGKAKPRGKSG